MKVFWQYVDDADRLLATQNSSLESVELPIAVHKALEEALHSNMKMLPSSARRFQEWNVSLLERFECKEPRKFTNPIDPLFE